MALVVKDRVKVSTTTTGTGTISLGTVATGFQGFSAIGDGNTTYYAVISGSQWEVGIGTYTASGNTLSRDTILDSSNSGSAITLAGTSDVFCAYPAEYSVSYDKETVLTGFLDVPAGTTAQRPSVPDVGMIRFNSDLGVMESYDGGTWRNMYEPAPEITSVSPTDYNGNAGTTITVNGNYFGLDAAIYFKPSGGSYTQATTTTYVNSNQVTATTPIDYAISQQPLTVKIEQSTGLDELADAITLGAAPTWTTASGTLVTVNPASSVSTSVVANDSDGSIQSYAITSGSLPAGVSLNTSTGAITGTSPSPASETTYTFGITATDNAGNTTGERSFNIVVRGTAISGQYLVVAGGAGGGGGWEGGGGGAGGTIENSSATFTFGSVYSATVGGGGAAGTGGGNGRGGNGSNSSLIGTGISVTCTGGGGGCSFDGAPAGPSNPGGSSGGAHRGVTAASFVSGQGNRGGTGPSSATGGGGGKGSAGGNSVADSAGGNGGTGLVTSISGSSLAYAGGGGGCSFSGTNGTGGSGVGGNGASGSGTAGAGATNRGGGGGGHRQDGYNGGAGGSGVVIIRVPTARYSGVSSGSRTISTSGSDTIIRFTGNGTYTA